MAEGRKHFSSHLISEVRDRDWIKINIVACLLKATDQTMLAHAQCGDPGQALHLATERSGTH